MTLMYTFSRRGRVDTENHAHRGFERCPPCLELLCRCQPDAAPFTVPLPTRCCHLRGAAGRGRAINRYVTFLYRGF